MYVGKKSNNIEPWPYQLVEYSSKKLTDTK